jgi:16S rRNA (adenine1518-N6/adenine1519-N6)-dimethyltransferase
VLEIGAGLGSLTVALADAGAEVVAVEFDRSLAPALREVVGPRANVRLEFGDALRLDLASLLDRGDWVCVSNLPYNAAVPIVMRMLEGLRQVRSYLVMMQREVGERIVARPGERAYGAVSVRVAYRADATLVRRVPATVFWPQPKVESVLLRLVPKTPDGSVPERALFRLVEVGFAQRRKTVVNALRRLGLSAREAADLLAAHGLARDARAERLGLEEFAHLAADLVDRGVLGETHP